MTVAAKQPPPRRPPARQQPAPRPAARPAPPAARPAPAQRPAARPAPPSRAQPQRTPAKAPARSAVRPPAGTRAPGAPKTAARPAPGRQTPAQRPPAPKPRTRASANRPAAPQAAGDVAQRLGPRAYAGSSAQKHLWAQQLIAAAGYARIPVDVLWGVFGMETRWGNYIGTSSASATGLMQFIPSTAERYNYPQTNYPSTAQSQQQMTAAALYLRDLRREYGQWNEAIIHYSGGGYNLHDVETTGASYHLPSDLWPPRSSGSSPSPSSGQQRAAYVNPLAHANVRAERIDQGVDYAGSGYLVAIAYGKVSFVSGSAWQPYGNYLEYQILQKGSLYGAYVYYAEGINPVVHDGEYVQAGARVADIISGWRYGMELGFAAGTSAYSYYRYHDGGYSEGDATRPGIAFSNLVKKLGGPAGVIEGPVVGNFPEYMKSGEPGGDIAPGTFTAPGIGIGGQRLSEAGGAAAYTWPGAYESAFVQLQRGIGTGAHHSNAAWYYAGGVIYKAQAQ